MKQDWWLVFYRPLSGPAVSVDFLSAEPHKPLPEPADAEWVYKHVAVLGRTEEEMLYIKLGAQLALVHTEL